MLYKICWPKKISRGYNKFLLFRFPMISTDNTSMIENFDSMLKKMDMLKEEIEERNIECLETVKSLLVEKTQDQENGKDKKK